LALCLVGGGGVRADNIQLPELGDESVTVISPAQERKLGEDFMRKARRSLKFVDDAELNEYVQQLGTKLVVASDGAYKDFRFFMIDDASINAFAVPGGFVGVHTGLVLNTQNESELASVLAHETAHVTQRHIPRLINEEQKANLPTMAALLATILLAGSGHGDVATAGAALTTATSAQRGINFTRSFEEEADRIGMGILARANFDPRAMPIFFERMQTANRYNESNLPEFLRTHPVTTNRIADSRNRAETYPTKNYSNSSEFEHVRAKVRALAPGDASEIARGFKENIIQGKYRDLNSERYGYALALLRAKDIPAARSEALKLTALAHRNPYYGILAAEIEMADGKYKEAAAIYRDLYRRQPNSLPVARHTAQALLKTGQTKEAYAILKPLVRRYPENPDLQKMLATAAGETGAKIEAHQALAEHYYLNGNPNAALDQLRLAARLVGDNFYLQASIDARSQAIRDEIALYKGGK
jgi:predicted Zn-dependent protease